MLNCWCIRWTAGFRILIPRAFCLKNQSVYAVSGTSRCLFSDKYKTHKYSVGETYSCWMLNCWCIRWTAGFRRLIPRAFCLKNQSVYAVSGTSRCLFSDKYKTHKYSLGETYSYSMLNWWYITWPVGFRRLMSWAFCFKNQSVYAVSGTSRCLFSDKNKTHKYSVGRAYSCWMLNCWYITWPVGL